LPKSKKHNEKKSERIKIFYEGVEEKDVKLLVNHTRITAQNLNLPVQIEDAERLWTENLKDEIFEKLAKIRVFKWNEFEIQNFVSPVEIQFERRKAEGKIKSFGIVYEGFLLQGIFLSAISGRIDEKRDFPVVITDRQIATFGDDGRFHLRVAVIGFPSIVSKTGLFSAPAKPKEYHIAKFVSEDVALLKGYSIKEEVEKKFYSLGRPYVILTYLWLKEAIGFCENPVCFFSDSHTIEELFISKSGKIKLCDFHSTAITNSYKRKKLF